MTKLQHEISHYYERAKKMLSRLHAESNKHIKEREQITKLEERKNNLCNSLIWQSIITGGIILLGFGLLLGVPILLINNINNMNVETKGDKSKKQK